MLLTSNKQWIFIANCGDAVQRLRGTDQRFWLGSMFFRFFWTLCPLFRWCWWWSCLLNDLFVRWWTIVSIKIDGLRLIFLRTCVCIINLWTKYVLKWVFVGSCILKCSYLAIAVVINVNVTLQPSSTMNVIAFLEISMAKVEHKTNDRYHYKYYATEKRIFYFD